MTTTTGHVPPPHAAGCNTLYTRRHGLVSAERSAVFNISELNYVLTEYLSVSVCVLVAGTGSTSVSCVLRWTEEW